MSVLSHNILHGASGAREYEIDNSLRFNDNDSAYLSRTPASAGNRKTWTWAGWVKRGNVDTYQVIFQAGSTTVSTPVTGFRFDNTGALRLSDAGVAAVA